MNGVIGGAIRATAAFDTGHMKIMSRAYGELSDQIPNDLALDNFSQWQANLESEFSQMISRLSAKNSLPRTTESRTAEAAVFRLLHKNHCNQQQSNHRLKQQIHSQQALALYKRLLEAGVAREQARGVLPFNIYTEFYWTASLQAIVNFIQLRTHETAQYEIRQYADVIESLTTGVVPVSYRHLLHREVK